MSGNPCLILEWSEADQWPGLFGAVSSVLAAKPLRVPDARRPAVLQPNREIAEREAKRLAERHPGRHFAVFEAQMVATTVEIPTHTTVGGKVWASRKVPALLTVEDDDVALPF